MTALEIPYQSPLLGNIRQALAGLQGYDAMALELIQNADDAEAQTISFDIRDNGLYVENNASFTTCGMRDPECPWVGDGDPTERRRACDFHAISTVGSANKYGESSLIGRFGIGFVSVYQITDSPIVRSGTTQLRLDPVRGKNLVEQITEANGSAFELPWAVDETSPAREALYASAVGPDVCARMLAAFEETTKSSLLFLKHLRTIEVLANGELKVRVSLERSDSHLTVNFEPEGNPECWYVMEANAAEKASTLNERFRALKRLHRQTELQIAFRLDGLPDGEGLLYAYLPTQQATLLPCHINADFFPEQDRRSIVLSGEQHERYWNEMLLGVAAETIANNLLDLRDAMGPEQIWSVLTAAFESRQKPAFDVFWERLSSRAQESAIVWTADRRWVTPACTKIPPRQTTTDDEAALARIGLDLVHECIRPHQNALQSLGGRQLSLSDVIEALENWQDVQRDDDVAGGLNAIELHIQPLWTTVERFLPAESEDTDADGNSLQRLGQIRFIPKWEGGLLALNELYRTPTSLSNEDVEEYVPGIPLVSDRIQVLPKLWGRIDVLDSVALASVLAERIVDLEAAENQLGTDARRLKRFYHFLASYPRLKGEAETLANKLQDVSFLRGASGFLKPREAVFAGGFRDPVGNFEIIDAAAFDAIGKEFVSDILGVETLTFQKYVRDYLPDLLRDGITTEQYTALIGEIIDHRDLLQDEEMVAVLADLPLLLTMRGTFTTPSQAYFRTEDLALLLGDDPELWIDHTALPARQRKFALALFENLGMARTPSANRIVERIEEIVDDDPNDETRKLVQRLFTFLSQQYIKWQEEESENVEDLEPLRNISWIPASHNGEPDRESWFEPSEVYQPFRSAGFLTQVPVLDFRGSRANPIATDFLNFLRMPAEPSTAVIVDHLQHCMNSLEAANDTIYQILFERLRDKDGIAAIDQLQDRACIFNPATGQYLKPKQVFWSRPHLGQYGFQATPRMGAQRELFEHLGVTNEPDHEAYAEILIRIAEDYGRDAEPVARNVQLIHGICISKLSELVSEDPNTADSILDRLEETPFLLTNAGTLAFSGEIALRDSDWLAEPFGEDLLSRLVNPVAEARPLYQRLGIKLLSQVVEIEPVRLGEFENMEEKSRLIRERSELFLWLLGSLPRNMIRRMREILTSIEIVSTDFIQIQSKFLLDDPEIVSAPRTTMCFYDKADKHLYVHENSGSRFWSNAFKALFNTLISSDQVGDLRQVIFIAASVAKAGSLAEAQEALEEAGFVPPTEKARDQVDLEGSELGDFDETDQGSQSEASKESAAEEVSKDVDDGTTNGGEDQNARPPQTSGQGSGKSSAEAGTSGTFVDGAGGADGSDRSDETERPKRKGDRDQSRTVSKRTEWMRSYVVPKGKESDRKPRNPDADDLSAQIDDAAMRAVLEYEEVRRWKPERKPHNNPGFDVLSLDPAGTDKRLIEVKGLKDEWTGRGVKMSRTQFDNAEYFGDEFWLYVVEFSLDDKRRRVYAIKNPAFKASEFWFDHVWKEVADEEGGDLRSRFVTGVWVRVMDWGDGEIIDVRGRGIAREIIINFDSHGKKALPFNMDRMELIEE